MTAERPLTMAIALLLDDPSTKSRVNSVCPRVMPPFHGAIICGVFGVNFKQPARGFWPSLMPVLTAYFLDLAGKSGNNRKDRG